MTIIQETIRYTYRLRPSRSAKRSLTIQWDSCRFIWNLCVASDRDKEKGIPCTFNTMSKKLTELRAELDWLGESSSVPQQQTIRTWYVAKQQGFKVKGRGKPVFKSRHKSLPSLQYTQSGFRVTDNILKLAKGISIPIVLSRELPSMPSSVTVYADATGAWWCSFVVKRDKELFPETQKELGIDWGLKAIATTTDSEFDLANSRHGRAQFKQLKKLQQRMSRRYKHGAPASRGYREAKLSVAKLHKKITNVRADESRKWARKLLCRAMARIYASVG